MYPECPFEFRLSICRCNFSFIESGFVLIDNVDVFDKRSAFMWACYKGMIPVILKLIEMGCNINLTDRNGNSALQ